MTEIPTSCIPAITAGSTGLASPVRRMEETVRFLPAQLAAPSTRPSLTHLAPTLTLMVVVYMPWSGHLRPSKRGSSRGTTYQPVSQGALRIQGHLVLQMLTFRVVATLTPNSRSTASSSTPPSAATGREQCTRRAAALCTPAKTRSFRASSMLARTHDYSASRTG